MNIAIRTTLGPTTGIGQYMRMHRLAAELKNRGVDVHILVDDISCLRWLPQEVPVSALSMAYETFSSTVDAERTIQFLKREKCDTVIVDDYRLDVSWEELLRSASFRLIAFDDLCRRHSCDMLIDMKWRGEETFSVYDNLLPPETVRLLGPAYVILDPIYGKEQHIRREVSEFTVTLSLGGGGDMNLLAPIAEGILTSSSQRAERPIVVQVIIGPQAYNCQTIQQFAKEHPSLRLISGACSLYKFFRKTHLYIGAIGGAIYELLALKIPAITFSLASNQNTELKFLRDIGHHFHIPDYNFLDTESLCSLFWSFYENYDRAAVLCRAARVKIDGEGCKRIADAVVKMLKSVSPTILHYKPATSAVPKMEEVGGGYTIRHVCDADMGHYLESRNLRANRKNMIQQGRVREIHHYQWWLSTKRSSFLIQKNGLPLLYIWHEKILLENDPYLVGGWFVCTEACKFNDVLFALSWQLKNCDRTEPGVPWIAVIRKTNRFVRMLNKYMGFRDAPIGEKIHTAITTFFQGVTEQDFFFVYR